jgi:hypothetical protein
VTILRRGLESLADKNVDIKFGEAFTDDKLVIGYVITQIFYNARNDVFDDTPCI